MREFFALTSYEDYRKVPIGFLKEGFVFCFHSHLFAITLIDWIVFTKQNMIIDNYAQSWEFDEFWYLIEETYANKDQYKKFDIVNGYYLNNGYYFSYDELHHEGIERKEKVKEAMKFIRKEFKKIDI